MKLFVRDLDAYAKPAPRHFLISCLILAACLLAVLLRLHQAQAPMVFDEYASMYFSDRPFRDLWGWWLSRETNLSGDRRFVGQLEDEMTILRCTLRRSP